jgi:predicted transcriptional regulator
MIMTINRLGPVEYRFAELVWENAPIGSGELVKLCQRELQWKKPTTYTVLRKLCERGLFQNNGGTVTPLISRDEYFALQSEEFVEETFGGSLPGFIAAFTKRRTLTPEEAATIRKMIEEF